MWKTNQNSDSFDNITKIEEEEYTYPWNNEQLNFDIIIDITTNKEEIQDLEIIIPDENFSDEEEKNNTRNENESVINLVKKNLDYEGQTVKKNRDK